MFHCSLCSHIRPRLFERVSSITLDHLSTRMSPWVPSSIEHSWLVEEAVSPIPEVSSPPVPVLDNASMRQPESCDLSLLASPSYTMSTSSLGSTFPTYGQQYDPRQPERYPAATASLVGNIFAMDGRHLSALSRTSYPYGSPVDDTSSQTVHVRTMDECLDRMPNVLSSHSSALPPWRNLEGSPHSRVPTVDCSDMLMPMVDSLRETETPQTLAQSRMRAGHNLGFGAGSTEYGTNELRGVEHSVLYRSQIPFHPPAVAKKVELHMQAAQKAGEKCGICEELDEVCQLVIGFRFCGVCHSAGRSATCDLGRKRAEKERIRQRLADRRRRKSAKVSSQGNKDSKGDGGVTQ